MSREGKRDNVQGMRELADRYAAELDAQFQTLNHFANHAGEIGRAHEYFLRTILRRFLPARFRVGTGFIASPNRTSPQQDVLVYDPAKSPLLFEAGDLVVVDAEATAAAIEVKSELSGSRLKDACRKLLNEMASSGGQTFHGLYAWDSSSLGVWIEAAWDIVRERAKETGRHRFDFPVVYVRDRFLLFPNHDGNWWSPPFRVLRVEEHSEGAALLGFIGMLWFRLQEHRVDWPWWLDGWSEELKSLEMIEWPDDIKKAMQAEHPDAPAPTETTCSVPETAGTAPGRSDADAFRRAYEVLESRMAQLAESDGDLYVPNVAPTRPVDFVLICMEPSFGHWASIEEARAQLQDGFRNFLYSIGDFILHYCARNYLCRERRAFHLTDMSKGAMLVKKAGEARKKRYARWHALLVDEVQLVAKDGARAIAVGSVVKKHLDKHGLPVPVSKVLHYSVQARLARNKGIAGHEAAYEDFRGSVSFRDIVADATEVLRASGIPDALQEETLARLKRSKFTDSEEKLIFNYKLAFESLATETA